MRFVLIKVKAEQLGFIRFIIADHKGFCDLSAFNQLSEPYKLTELAFQVKPVALPGDKIDGAPAGFQFPSEFWDIYIVQFNQGHRDSSFSAGI